MPCYECGCPKVQRTRDREFRCPRCGTRVEVPKSSSLAREEMPSTVVVVYTVGLSLLGLLMPFVIPWIIRFSLAHS